MLVKKERNSEIDDLLSRSYHLFEAGDFSGARTLLDEAHARDFEDREVRSALRACGFWAERMRNLDALDDDGTRGDYLRRQWKHFADRYSKGLEHPMQEGADRLKKCVLGRAIDCYSRRSASGNDTEAYLQAGRCQKALGRYEDCIAAYEEALSGDGRTDSRVLAELADAYALIGETKAAKVMMREAMFLDAGSIEQDEIASPLFRRLIERTGTAVDPNGPDFREWLPVYGEIWGVLDVSRELSPVEYGKLKQSIYALKNEIADGDVHKCLTPRLINRYFRLIAYYRSAGTDRTAIDEALIEIKLLSPSIYKEYYG